MVTIFIIKARACLNQAYTNKIIFKYFSLWEKKLHQTRWSPVFVSVEKDASPLKRWSPIPT